MLLKCKVLLRNEEGRPRNTTIHVSKGQIESLLGKEDAIALWIIKITTKGDPPTKKPSQTAKETKPVEKSCQVKRETRPEEEDSIWERLRCITPTILENPKRLDSIVSGAKNSKK